MKKSHRWIGLLLLLLLPAFSLAEAGQCARVCDVTEYATLREKASGRGKDIGHVPLGDLVVLLGETEEDFVPVSWQGKFGYVRAPYLEAVREKEGNEVPLDDALRIQLNLFLTQFTRYHFAQGTAYLQENPGRDQISAFAGTWAQRSQELVPMSPEEAALQFFSMSFPMEEETELLEDTGGFASVHLCREIVPGLWRVEFIVIGEGKKWEPEGVCGIPQARALAVYGPRQATGVAYIRTQGQSEQEYWILNRYVTIAD